jgi:hypothetical protein
MGSCAAVRSSPRPRSACPAPLASWWSDMSSHSCSTQAVGCFTFSQWVPDGGCNGTVLEPRARDALSPFWPSRLWCATRACGYVSDRFFWNYLVVPFCTLCLLAPRARRAPGAVGLAGWIGCCARHPRPRRLRQGLRARVPAAALVVCGSCRFHCRINCRPCRAGLIPGISQAAQRRTGRACGSGPGARPPAQMRMEP